MGVLYGYYSAADDKDAARAVVREFRRAEAGCRDQHVTRGIDPVVELLPAEVLITGRAPEDVRSDPRRGALVGVAGEGRVVAVCLTDTFRDALAAFDADLLDDVAMGWSRSCGGLNGVHGPDVLGPFLKELAGLAGRASAHGRRLYCWIRP
ncbi:hypothetical protein PV703_26460 [Streptomyces sp. ME01-24h]|nr:hypothetical protein [Streptomyces sp. ME19-03-3]MDX3356781.1 hypothetical protein [Streptomyces sp. ME01-24h]